MVSNHGYECKANRTTYSQEVDREHDSVESLLLPLLRHPCPPINVGGCNEEIIFERCTRVGEFLHILQFDTALPVSGRDDTFVTRACLREECDCCTLIQVSGDKDDNLF
jgi:hypothetical protein